MSSSPAAGILDSFSALAGAVPGPGGGAPAGLLQALARVPYPRDRRGIRYPLVPVLAAAACAVLAGAQSFAAIAEWARDAPADVLAGLGLTGPCPTSRRSGGS